MNTATRIDVTRVILEDAVGLLTCRFDGLNPILSAYALEDGKTRREAERFIYHTPEGLRFFETQVGKTFVRFVEFVSHFNDLELREYSNMPQMLQYLVLKRLATEVWTISEVLKDYRENLISDFTRELH